MARIARRKPEGPSEEERARALDLARAMLAYSFCAVIEPPYSREQIESMSAPEVRQLAEDAAGHPAAVRVLRLLKTVEAS